MSGAEVSAGAFSLTNLGGKGSAGEKKKKNRKRGNGNPRSCKCGCENAERSGQARSGPNSELCLGAGLLSVPHCGGSGKKNGAGAGRGGTALLGERG